MAAPAAIADLAIGHDQVPQFYVHENIRDETDY